MSQLRITITYKREIRFMTDCIKMLRKVNRSQDSRAHRGSVDQGLWVETRGFKGYLEEAQGRSIAESLPNKISRVKSCIGTVYLTKERLNFQASIPGDSLTISPIEAIKIPRLLKISIKEWIWIFIRSSTVRQRSTM